MYRSAAASNTSYTSIRGVARHRRVRLPPRVARDGIVGADEDPLQWLTEVYTAARAFCHAKWTGVQCRRQR